VDEQGPVPPGEHVQQRPAPAVAGLVGQRGRRQLKPDEPPVEQPGEAGRIDLGQARRGPAGERPAQPGDPVVVGAQQRPGVRRVQVLDAQRAGQADYGQADAVAGGQRGPARHVVIGRVDGERRLPGRDQRPAVEPRRPGPPPQFLDQRARPDMLVDIDVHDAPSRLADREPPAQRLLIRFTEAVHLCDSVNRFSSVESRASRAATRLANHWNLG
jgi:hypothetical protein